MESKTEEVIEEDQFGFRKGKGTRDDIELMRIISERTDEEIGQVLCLEHCFIWLRDLDTKKIGTEVFGEL